MNLQSILTTINNTIMYLSIFIIYGSSWLVQLLVKISTILGLLIGASEWYIQERMNYVTKCLT